MSRFGKCEAVDEEEVDVEVDLAVVLLKVDPVDLHKAGPEDRVVLHRQRTRKPGVVLGSSHWRV